MTSVRLFFRHIYVALMGRALGELDSLLDQAHDVVENIDAHIEWLDRRVEARIQLATDLAEKNQAETREAARAESIRNRIADILDI